MVIIRLRFSERGVLFVKNAFQKLFTVLLIASLMTGIWNVALAENESISIKLLNQGDIYYGDQVTLMAIVNNAESGYQISWEKYNSEDKCWVKVGSGERYSFTVTESNAASQFRAVLIIAE